MHTWIKICGLKDAEAVATAVELDVSAIGFVFASSPRQISAQEAAQLASTIPPHISKVAVFLRPGEEEVKAVLNEFTADIVQADWQSLAAIEFEQDIKLLPVYRETSNRPAVLPEFPFIYEGAKSGQGETVDWQVAAELAADSSLILAGGLTPKNISHALKQVNPFGVDVSSGVESQAGVKDLKKIRDFVTAVRSTAQVDATTNY